VPLLPDPQVIESTWDLQPPNLLIVLTFDIDMNQTVTPSLASFDLKFDGVDEPLTGVTWLNATQLQLTSDQSTEPASPVTLELLDIDPDFRSLAGEPVLPFGRITVIQIT